MKRKVRIGLICTGLMCILVMLIISGWFLLKPQPLIVQGEVEATQIRVASKIVGRVEAVHVDEGESVKKGQHLVTLDSPEILAKLAQATAARNAADAQQKKAYSGTRIEKIQSAFNFWKKAEVGVDLAQKTYNRVKRLYADGVVPAQKLDETEAQLKAAKETAAAARATYDMAVAGARKEDKEAAAAMVDRASGVVSEVEAYLKETNLISPLDGEIVSIIAEPGELISPGYPIITIVDLEDIWVTFNLREDLLSSIRMGSILTARFPALGNQELRLKINYISALGDYATWRATKTSGDFDLKTFEVRAVPLKPAPGLRPGMSAIVTWNQSPAFLQNTDSKK